MWDPHCPRARADSAQVAWWVIGGGLLSLPPAALCLEAVGWIWAQGGGESPGLLSGSRLSGDLRADRKPLLSVEVGREGVWQRHVGPALLGLLPERCSAPPPTPSQCPDAVAGRRGLSQQPRRWAQGAAHLRGSQAPQGDSQGVPGCDRGRLATPRANPWPSSVAS